MNILQAIFLAVIEGITEFLPVSSTGHMILASRLAGIGQSEFVKSFEIIIQSGAVAAICLFIARQVALSGKVAINVLTSFIPSAVTGYIFYHFIKSALIGNSTVVLWALTLGGIGMIIFEKMKPAGNPTASPERLSWKQAVVIGIFQAVSMIPGVSRSAATIIGAMVTGMSRRDAVLYSFYLAVPTMFSATALDLLSGDVKIQPDQSVLVLTGIVIAFLSAYISVRFFVKFIRTNTFIPFGVYRILLALALWIVFTR